MAQFIGRMNRTILMLFTRPMIPVLTPQTPLRALSMFSGHPFAPLATPLLQAVTPIVNQSCGMKVKGQLRRRCKDCYFVWRHESKKFS